MSSLIESFSGYKPLGRVIASDGDVLLYLPRDCPWGEPVIGLTGPEKCYRMQRLRPVVTFVVRPQGSEVF